MNRHKIAILTQPLEVNYGGLLQAYALRTVLLRKGHIVKVINRPKPEFSKSQKFFMLSKSLLLRYIFRDKSRILYPWILDKELNIIRKNTVDFVNKYIQPTEELNSTRDLNQFSRKGFTAFIVGSDQVWRPHFSPQISNYFFDFLGGNKVIKRISYAASFGTDISEYTINERDICGQLLQKFDAVSVREDSGIVLCEELFSVKAEQVLDPTLLLGKEDYEDIIKCEKEKENKNELFIYILDESNVKNDIIEKVSKALFFRPFTVKPQKAFSVNNRKEIELGIYPRVSTWLRAFKDAKYVITDSFHGCVFSIIFNKPFIAIGNKERGMTRFISLLKIFGLENRLITNIDDLSEDLIKYNFNWNKINKIKYEWQKSSVSFIDKSLKL